MLPAAQLRQKLALHVQTRGQFVLPVQILQHVAVDDGIEVRFTEVLDDLVEVLEALLPQQAGCIEVLLGQTQQSARRIGGKANRTAIVSPYCSEMEARVRANLRLPRTLP